MLLVGLLPADREPLLAAIRSASPRASVQELLGRRETTAVLSTADVQCVVVGQAALAGTTWEAVGSELRQLAPQAALVAMTGATDLGGSWDDAVRPHERDAAMLARVVRSAFTIAAANRRLVRWAMRDPLTDLLNRRGLERVLTREASEQERGAGPVVALLVDCDDFKAINDRFGLTIGDDVLRRLAEVLGRSVRGRDTVARVGGDEFVVVLPATRTWEGVQTAERIRAAVRAGVRLPDGDTLTVSIGVRRLDGRVTSVGDLVAATQDGLRQSKVAGKDQVRVVDGRGASGPVLPARDRTLGPEFVDDDPVLPPGARLFEFQVGEVRDGGGDGAVVARIVRPELEPDARLVVSAHRASEPGWDLKWFHHALAVAQPVADVPVHVRIFPGTVREDGPGVRAALTAAQIPLDRVTLALDDQYLTGDPGPLAADLAELRLDGVGLCLDLTDLGRACLEALILLRPERVRLDGAITEGIANSRIRRATTGRFVRICQALGIEVIARRDPPEERRVLLELGVRRFDA